jgi:DNA-binding SARP family transcriptional activator
MSSSALATGSSSEVALMLCLVRGPYVVRAGRQLAVPEGSQRLLAYVALHGGRVDRRRAAGTLWPEGSDDRAAGNLRSALWRLKSAGVEVLRADKTVLALTPGTVTDVHQLCDWATRVIAGRADAADLQPFDWCMEAAEILPGWYDDWVITERERIRQKVLHGLEALGRCFLTHGRPVYAVEAALHAIRIEPLRESAQHLLIDAHLAEGNVIEALRSYATYAALLRSELGVKPSPALAAALPTRRGDASVTVVPS